MRTVRFYLFLVFLSLISQTMAGIIESVKEKFQTFVEKTHTCGMPKITNVMRNRTLQAGDVAKFRCTVDMKCMVSYIHWYHEMENGTEVLLRTAADSGDPYTYKIDNVDWSHEGFYTCRAGNFLGDTEISAYLEVADISQEHTGIDTSTLATICIITFIVLSLGVAGCGWQFMLRSRRQKEHRRAGEEQHI